MIADDLRLMNERKSSKYSCNTIQIEDKHMLVCNEIKLY